MSFSIDSVSARLDASELSHSLLTTLAVPPTTPHGLLELPLDRLLALYHQLQLRLVITLTPLLMPKTNPPIPDPAQSSPDPDTVTADVSDAKRSFIYGFTCLVFSEMGIFVDHLLDSVKTYGKWDSIDENQAVAMVLPSFLGSLRRFIRSFLCVKVSSAELFLECGEILDLKYPLCSVLETVWLKSDWSILYLSLCCVLCCRGVGVRDPMTSPEMILNHATLLCNPSLGLRETFPEIASEMDPKLVSEMIVCPCLCRRNRPRSRIRSRDDRQEEEVLIDDDDIVAQAVVVSLTHSFHEDVRALISSLRDETITEGGVLSNATAEEKTTVNPKWKPNGKKQPAPAPLAPSSLPTSFLSAVVRRSQTSASSSSSSSSEQHLRLLFLQQRKLARQKAKAAALEALRLEHEGQLGRLESQVSELRSKWTKAILPSRQQIPDPEMMRRDFDALDEDFRALVEGEATTKWFDFAFVNRMKNRYPGHGGPRPSPTDFLTWPYSFNIPKISGGEYINASEITNHGFTYICTQFPLDSTMGDFWDMILRNQVRVIVALQGPNPEKQLFPYWPKHAGDTKRIGRRFVIRTKSADVIKGSFEKIVVEVRKQHLLTKSPPETVHLLLFRSWPDHGLPTDSHGDFEFGGLHDLMTECFKLEKSAKKKSMNQSPLCVHCTAGIGRTGVFVVAHNLLATGGGLTELRSAVFKFRTGRYGLVGYSFPQYQYLHHLVKYCQTHDAEEEEAEEGGGEEEDDDENVSVEFAMESLIRGSESRRRGLLFGS